MYDSIYVNLPEEATPHRQRFVEARAWERLNRKVTANGSGLSLGMRRDLRVEAVVAQHHEGTHDIHFIR